MKNRISVFALILTLVVMPASLKAAETVRHDLKIVLYPAEQRFTAEDTITLPEKLVPGLQFLLHSGMQPSSPTPGTHIIRDAERSEAVPLESFKVSLPPGRKTFVLEYGGTIGHGLQAYGKEQARGFKRTPGVISKEGVYLAGNSGWYPRFGKELVIFTLKVELPLKWDAVSQGERTLHTRKKNTTLVQWESPQVQEEIYLIAAPFIEYTQPEGRVAAMVFLRKPDEALAGKYLDAAVRYLAMYAELIGPYPYKKFALVENFWETGFGMPSFTLLGSKIIRFPFILHSSYPHEILHNWWGNSVYPDYGKGNWTEGLTAYLADHLVKEIRGNAAAYRQGALQKYTDYVLKGRDFTLVQFRSRHSASSAAVGYGKSLMFFHMLRQKLGDETFIRGLRDFYRENRFRMATFDDLRKSFESVSEKDMSIEFNQWTARSGAPALTVGDLQVVPDGDGWMLNARIEQVQTEGVYLLRIPVAVTMEGQSRAYQRIVVMDKKRLELKLRLPARPVRMDVDPEFDLFRRLDRDEIPAALSQALGAKKMLILLPSSADKNMIEAYRDLAVSFSKSGPDEVTVKLDTEVPEIPADRAVILCGWENHFLNEFVATLSGYDVTINQEKISMGHTSILRENHAVVLTTRQPKNKNLSLTWVASDLPQALPGLGRKLPHYHKYSYLGFQGHEPTNIAKGRWPVLASPMTAFVPGKDNTIQKIERGKLAPRKPLATLAPVFSKKQMMAPGFQGYD
jgi:aminopeptidase N